MALIVGEVAAVEVGPGKMTLPAFGLVLGVGVSLWVAGEVGNFVAHWRLATLRRPGETDYKVPRGGLFGWVACPHYLWELVAWWGFTLVLHHVAGAVMALTMTWYLAGRAHRTPGGTASAWATSSPTVGADSSHSCTDHGRCRPGHVPRYPCREPAMCAISRWNAAVARTNSVAGNVTRNSSTLKPS